MEYRVSTMMQCLSCGAEQYINAARHCRSCNSNLVKDLPLADADDGRSLASKLYGKLRTTEHLLKQAAPHLRALWQRTNGGKARQELGALIMEIEALFKS